MYLYLEPTLLTASFGPGTDFSKIAKTVAKVFPNRRDVKLKHDYNMSKSCSRFSPLK
jgi:hypothetical protein